MKSLVQVYVGYVYDGSCVVSLLKVPLRIYLCVVKLETRYDAHRKVTLFALVGGCFASLPFFVAADSTVLLQLMT